MSELAAITTAAERDFSNFQLGDNVYELAGELIPEIADRLKFDLSSEPNGQELYELTGVLGRNEVLRDNDLSKVMAINRAERVQLLRRSGVQKPLNRSLWTPDVDARGVDALVVTGAVANWQDRGVALVASTAPKKKKSQAERRKIETPVYVATGGRVMKSATEVVNPNVENYQAAHGELPTESDYAAAVVVPGLLAVANSVKVDARMPSNGNKLAVEFFARNPYLLHKKLAFARVANAGIQLAVQMRNAARSIDPDFDADPTDPQVFVLTDTFKIARTKAEEGNPKEYQNNMTGLRQAVMTAKMLHEAAGGE